MPAPLPGLGADGCPGAGTLGISLRADAGSWPQSPLGFAKAPVMFVILASALGTETTTIFKHPIEHVLFGGESHLVVSQIHQALRRVKNRHLCSLNAVLLARTAIFPGTPIAAAAGAFLLCPAFRLLCLWRLTDSHR